MRSASEMACSTVIDGFSAACGSWKIICSLDRNGRIADSLSPLISRPRYLMLPPVTGARPSTDRPSVDLPEPDSPTSPTTSPGITSRFTPSSALTDPTERPNSRPTADPPRAKCTDRSVNDKIGVRESVCFLAPGQASSATSTSSCTSGAPFGRRSANRVAADGIPLRDRRADPSVTGSLSAQIAIACGQRGWNRQPGGGSPRSGGAPGIVRSSVVVSEMVAPNSSRVYGCLRVGENLGHRALFDDPAGVHHGHPVARLADDAEVVRDQQHGRREGACGSAAGC